MRTSATFRVGLHEIGDKVHLPGHQSCPATIGEVIAIRKYHENNVRVRFLDGREYWHQGKYLKPYINEAA